MAKAADKPAAPQTPKTFMVGDQHLEIHMSFGMLHLLSKLCGDITGAVEMTTDNSLREAVLQALLSKRDAEGRIETAYNLMTSPITEEQASEILDWAQGHVFPFLLRAQEKNANLLEKYQTDLERLKSRASLLNGSEA